MNKTNLVVDFSNIAMRSLFMCTYANKGDVSTFDTDEECGVLIRKVAMDMAYVLRTFTPDRVILACDARNPWRRTLYDDIEGESYKGNRQKDNTLNWNKIFENLNAFKEILKERGFIITEIANAEADDVAALWKQESYNNGDNVILVSSDKDWAQLVDFDGNKFCVCFNPIGTNKGKKHLFLTDECSKWLISSSKGTDIFFNNYNSYKDSLSNLKSKDGKIDFTIIDPNKVVLDKIMCGDDGDNAPSIYEFYKNGKKVRMTPGRSDKILEELNIKNSKDLCEAAANNLLLPLMSKFFKREIEDIDINVRVMRQRKLVELNSVLFPEAINTAFEYHAKEVVNDGYITTSTVTLDTILNGTKYLDERNDPRKARESSIFDNLKGLEKFIPTTKLF